MKVTVRELHGSGPILAKTKVAENGEQFVQIYQRAKTINPFKQLYYAIKNITDSRIKPAEQWVRENVSKTCGKLDAMMLEQILKDIKNQHEKSPDVFIKPSAFTVHNESYDFEPNISFGFANKNFTASLDLNYEMTKFLKKQNIEYALRRPEKSESKAPQQWAVYTDEFFNKFEEKALSSNPPSAELKTKEKVDQWVFAISKYYFSEAKNITQEEKSSLRAGVNYLLKNLDQSSMTLVETQVIKVLKEVHGLLEQPLPLMAKEELKTLFIQTLTEAVHDCQQFESALKMHPDREILSSPMKMDRLLLRDYKQALHVFLHFYEGQSRPNANQKAMLESLALFLSENKQFMPVDMLASFEKRLNILGIACDFSLPVKNDASAMFDIAGADKRSYNPRRPEEDIFPDVAGSASVSHSETDGLDAGEE